MSGGLYMARYMITMMGFFSIYAGLVYNDFFSIALDLFGTKYEWPEDAVKGECGAFIVTLNEVMPITVKYNTSDADYC